MCSAVCSPYVILCVICIDIYNTCVLRRTIKGLDEDNHGEWSGNYTMLSLLAQYHILSGLYPVVKLWITTESDENNH